MENSLPLRGPAGPRRDHARTGWIHRARAASLHLLISIAVTLAVFAAMIAFWYPWPIFIAAGAPQLLLLVSVCDVVLGPALTFVVAAPGKPVRKLVIDLAVIGSLQIAALAYGVHTVHVARPVFNVFAVDRFELVSEADLDAAALADAPEAFRQLSQTGPTLVAARLPDDATQRRELLMSALTGGADLAQTPRLYVPYASAQAVAAAKGRPIDKLREHNPPADVDALLRDLGRAHDAVRWLPMRGGKRDLVVIVDAASGELLRVAALHPWPR
jgi:hypothetical protein